MLFHHITVERHLEFVFKKKKREREIEIEYALACVQCTFSVPEQAAHN